LPHHYLLGIRPGGNNAGSCLIHARFRGIQLRLCNLDAALRLRQFFFPVRLERAGCAIGIGLRRVKLLL